MLARRIAAAVTVSVALIGPGALPSVAAPSAPVPCDLHARTSLHWDTSDAKYLRLVAKAAYTRCSAAIASVNMMVTNYYATGEFHNSENHIRPGDRPGPVGSTQSLNGAHYIVPDYLDDLRPDGIVTFSGTRRWDDFASCTTLADGSTTTKMTGATFEAIFRAYDARGRTLVTVRTGRVPCGQDGISPAPVR